MLLGRKSFLLAMVLVLFMFAVLAGCGGGNANEPAAKPADEKAAGSATNTNTSKEDPPKEEPKPALKYLKGYGNFDFNNYPVGTFIGDATGYKVQYDVLPQEQASEKLNLVMASGADYDLVDSAIQDFFTFAENGALLDLTSLIEQYGPNIQRAIKPESLASTSVDGKIYGIPTQNVSYVKAGLLVRTDWLDKVGLSMPATLDEFTAMLQAFKDKDPGGNGAQNIPLTIAGSPLIDNVSGAFGLYADAGTQWSEVDGGLVNVANHPGLKDYTTYLRTLYQQGLLDKEFATNKAATAAEKFTSGRAGVLLSNWSSIPGYDEAIKKNFPDASYAFIPPLAGENGAKGFLKIGGLNKVTFVPKMAKNPEHAIRLIDALLDEHVFKDLYIGKEGETFKMDNGTYLPIEPAFFDQRGYSNNFVIGVDEYNFADYWQARLRKSDAMYENFKIINSVPEADQHMYPLAFAPYMPLFAEKNNQLNNIVSDNLIQMIVDGVSDDSVAKLQNAWNAAGGEAVTKEVNDWFSSK